MTLITDSNCRNPHYPNDSMATAKTNDTRSNPLANTSEAELNSLKTSLINFLENDKPYLEEELNLSTLANQLDTTDKKLSTLLNQYMNTTFYDLINSYRVASVKEKMASDKYDGLTLFAYESGFKSKTSFNRIFKKETGKSPSEFSPLIFYKIFYREEQISISHISSLYSIRYGQTTTNKALEDSIASMLHAKKIYPQDNVAIYMQTNISSDVGQNEKVTEYDENFNFKAAEAYFYLIDRVSETKTISNLEWSNFLEIEGNQLYISENNIPSYYLDRLKESIIQVYNSKIIESEEDMFLKIRKNYKAQDSLYREHLKFLRNHQKTIIDSMVTRVKRFLPNHELLNDSIPKLSCFRS
ncbi:hypothetical protein GQR58_023297 [Nymphon striatum]|nr:hypothetical protein GQR58_023297 [Nymphon striatum]